MELAEFANSVLHEGIGIYSIRLYPSAGGFHFEIQLDGINHPRGAVNLADCESYSRHFAEKLDAELALRKDDYLFIENLAEDNYTLEVSSAGAERELRLPEDLDRFKELPLKMIYLDGEKKTVKHVIYSRSVIEDGLELFVFLPYLPRGKKMKAQKMKKNLSDKEIEMLKIPLHDIVRINLFLDF